MIISFRIYSFVIFVGVCIGKASPKTLFKQSRPFVGAGREGAHVSVTGDVDRHGEVTLHVTTPQGTRSILLQRVQHPILHEQLQSFTVVGEKNGEPQLQFEDVSGDLHRKARQFFCDVDTGAIVSIVRLEGNELHVKGFLDHETRITPPESATEPTYTSNHPRKKRDLENMPMMHSVWRDDDSVEWSMISRLAVTPPKRTGWTGDDDDDDGDEDDELDDDFDDDAPVHKSDFLPVPAMFQDRSLWPQFRNRQSFAPRGSNREINAMLGMRPGLDDKRRRKKRQALHDMTLSPFRTAFTPSVPSTGFTSTRLPGSSTTPQQPFSGTYVVEVMVVVDVKTYADFDYDARKLEDYVMHFWQAVNLRMQAIVDPRIRLKIRSYGKILFSGFQQFIEASRVRVNNLNLVSLADVIERFRSWAQNYESNIMYAAHDVAILMTGENLCKLKANGSCPDSPKGIGYMGGACITARRFNGYTYDVAVAEVDRSFRGVLTATHELGHLLNASHDGEGDAESCTTSSGFIMSYSWKDAYKFNRFSSCSKISITKFLSDTWYSDCLRDESKESYAFPDTLPGKITTLEQQCSHYNAGIPCSVRPLESQCQNLCCENILKVSISPTPAADGTTCGPQKSCFAGQCVPDTNLPQVPSK